MKSYHTSGDVAKSPAKKVSITLSADLDRALKKVARLEHRTLSGILQEAGRFYLNIRQYEDLQNDLAKQARRLGVTSEVDLEKVIKKSRSDKE